MSTSTKLDPQQEGRNLEIDYLRAVSIFAVVFLHYCMFDPPKVALLPAFLPPLLATNGYYGVTTFFVISGYLITALSLRRYGSLDRIKLKQFYLYRAARILPGIITLVAINVAFLKLGVSGFEFDTNAHPLPRLLTYIFTFRANLYQIQFGTFSLPWDIMWSLAVEEMFYVFFPLICLTLKNTWLLCTFLGGVILYGPLHRALAPSLYDFAGCFDQMALGCLVAIAAASFKTKFPKPIQCLGILIWLGAYLGTDLHASLGDVVAGPSIIALGTAMILFGSAAKGGAVAAKPLSAASRPFALLGQLSYEIYLFHMVVFALIFKCWLANQGGGGLNYLNHATDLRFLIVLAVLVAVSWLAAKGVLDPVRCYMRSFFVQKGKTGSE